MSTPRTGIALASLTALLAFAAAVPAEAGGMYKSNRFTIVLGDAYPGYGYGYGYGFRSAKLGYGCGWLFDRYEDTGNPKWYKRWHMCRYGW
jgi:hypothetical protein